MARVTIARTALPATGLNITDATFATLATGANNGVEVPYREGDALFLKNTTAGAAVFTVKIAQSAQYSELGIAIPDETFSVPAAKTLIVPLAAVFKQPDGDVYIDCDIAGSVLMLAVSDT